MSISGRMVGGVMMALSLLCVPLAAVAEMIQVADEATGTGLMLQSATRGGVEVQYVMDRFAIESSDFEGETMQSVMLPGSFLPNNPGAPNLPSVGRTIAIPTGAEVTLTITATETRTYRDLSLAPAAPIQFENDDSPPQYRKDAAIYGTDALYPESPVVVSAPYQMRGIDVVTVGVTPFQYNPVTGELTVIERVAFTLDFVGGTGDFGEERMRNRYWEPLLRDHLMNYASLPEVSFQGAGGSRDGYEYVIICPDDAIFISWAETLAEWRKLQGISTGVFTLSEVGGSTTTAIESFLNNAYNTWGTPPAAFLILGDYPSSGDNRDYGVTSPTWSGYCKSDNIYADVNGDNLPDMAHARICAQTETQLETMINKMFDYEINPVTDPDFYQNPIIAGGWQTERWFILCCEVCYGHQVNSLGKTPIREYAIYSGYPGGSWSSNQNTYMVVNYFGPSGLGYIPSTPAHLTDWGGNATRIINDLNAGSYMLLHRDHGSQTGWGEPYFATGHLTQLNLDKYPFVFSINCLTGMYNWGGVCFTEQFHRQQSGALGLIAASEVSYSFVNDTFIWGMWDSMWPDFDPGYGDAENVGPSDLMTAFAQASGKHYLQASSFPYNPQHKVYTHHLFHHHGDAFIRMNTEVPTHLTVAHDDHLELDADTFTVTANAGAVIGLTVDGEIIGVADATGGPVAIPIIPQTEEGELRITVTMMNSYRYDETVPIEAGSILVNSQGTGDYPTIQAAIDAASEGNEIYLADGIYTGPGNRNLDFGGKPLTLESLSGNAANCIIDCQGSAGEGHRGFYFHSGETATSMVRNITVTNGYAAPPLVIWEEGGAVYCDGASPTFFGCHFTNSYAMLGGGAMCENGSAPSFTMCAFENNSADMGGGIEIPPDGNPMIMVCTFDGNSANYGGALSVDGATVNLNSVTFTGNSAQAGGAIACQGDGTIGLTSCTFEENAADFEGGALLVYEGSASLMGCTFKGNSAVNNGGAILANTATLALTRSIFNDNTSGRGGALAAWTTVPEINQCTFYANTATGDGGSSIFLGEGSNAVIEKSVLAFGQGGGALVCEVCGTVIEAELSCCDVYGNVGGDWIDCIADQLGLNGNFSLDPYFCDAANGDFLVWNYSPCKQIVCGQIGARGIGCWDLAASDDELENSQLRLERSHPNPFSERTTLTYNLPTAAPAMLGVYDLSGRLVRTLLDGTQTAGTHTVVWDGRNQHGEQVGSGVYYYQLTSPGESDTKQVILMR